MLVLAKGGSLITPSCATSDTSGWSTGNTIVLAFALAAAGALAYLFSGGAAAWQRHGRQPVAAVAVRPRETRDAAADAAPADELSWIAWAYAALASFPCCMPSSFSRTTQGHTGCSLPSLSLPCCRDRGTGARLDAAARAERSGGRPLLAWRGPRGALAVMLHSLQSGWAWNWPASEQGGFMLAVLCWR